MRGRRVSQKQRELQHRRPGRVRGSHGRKLPSLAKSAASPPLSCRVEGNRVEGWHLEADQLVLAFGEMQTSEDAAKKRTAHLRRRRYAIGDREANPGKTADR